MKRLAAIVSCAVACLTTATLAQTARLDTRVSRVRTIGSEVRRGNTDAFNCFEELTDITDASEYSHCVMDKITADGYNADSSKGYLLGVYATALEVMRPMMVPELTKYHGAPENMMAAEAEASWKVHLKAALSATSLTRGQFCTAVGAADLAKCKSEPFPF